MVVAEAIIEHSFGFHCYSFIRFVQIIYRYRLINNYGEELQGKGEASASRNVQLSRLVALLRSY